MSSRLAATMEEEEEEAEDRSLLADVANASSLLWEEEEGFVVVVLLSPLRCFSKSLFFSSSFSFVFFLFSGNPRYAKGSPLPCRPAPADHERWPAASTMPKTSEELPDAAVSGTDAELESLRTELFSSS